MSYVVVIEPGQQERNYWRDLWRYRELFYVLAWRDIAVRYKQTAIGAAWALIRPFLTMVIFTVIFGRIAKLPSDGSAPYPLMVFAGMLPWTFFSTGLSDASNSLIGNANLITKVYFPRLIVPTATVVVAFADFLVDLRHPRWHDGLVSIPAGLADPRPARLYPARLPGQHRPGLVDHRAQRQIPRFPLCHSVHRAVGVVCLAGRVQSSVVPAQWRLLYSLNPMVGVIDGFRWCILGGQSRLYLPGFAASLAVAAFFLWFGSRIGSARLKRALRI